MLSELIIEESRNRSVGHQEYGYKCNSRCDYQQTRHPEQLDKDRPELHTERPAAITVDSIKIILSHIEEPEPDILRIQEPV